MSNIQLHTALGHLAVSLTFIAFGVLIVSLLLKEDSVIKTSLYLFIAAGVFAIPVYLAGAPTKTIVEKIPGINTKAIEEHEYIARITFISIQGLGLLSICCLVYYRELLIRSVQKILVVIALVISILAVQTANSGVFIRHVNGNTLTTEDPEHKLLK